MDGLIKSEIGKAKNEVKRLFEETITDDRAFSYVILKYIFSVGIIDAFDVITDGANDGGVDFVYYDEDEEKVVLAQVKFREKLGVDTVVADFDKMYCTLQDFKNSHTGKYNSKLKTALQNALDRLPDDNPLNVEFALFATADFNVRRVNAIIEQSSKGFSADSVKIYMYDDIKKEIEASLSSLDRITKEEKVLLDKANHYLEYESKDMHGILCNISSSSIVRLYNQYASKGLFDLNIRKYIHNKLVDDRINRTLSDNRDNFWFLNNGITIACDNFWIDGNTIHICGFSVVNGGQTTYLISNYKGSTTGDFYIPCKIVEVKQENIDTDFFAMIAEATNSQKPIYARDLKSNSPEMISLKKTLLNNGVYLENKRGEKRPKKQWKHVIKSDELAQLILSFVFQEPGTARSGKQQIFGKDNLYSKVFKQNYSKDKNKKNFIIDLIDLYDRYLEIEKHLKKNPAMLKRDQEFRVEILKNGRQAVLALLGVVYRIANSDITERQLTESADFFRTISFYPVDDCFISCYQRDDLDVKLQAIVINLVGIITNAYRTALKNKDTTSVSNFLKPDSRYRNEIISELAEQFTFSIGEDIKDKMDIFKRN